MTDGNDAVPERSAALGGPLTGRRLGAFALGSLVGAGGFGDVYLADQVGLHREAIVKVLRASDHDDTHVARFLREAKLASRLDHPYAAHIYEFGAESDGVIWIAMEHVRGASLRAVIEAQGPMPLERFVPLLERICEVVHTAHEQGIVHRDLKPDNVMVIARAGRLLPKLLDFGIARAADTDLPAASAAATANDAAPATQTRRGAVLGSPPYMAPETWVDARKAGPAADQYALGALAYEALTGRIAFTGRTVIDIARAHARGLTEGLGDGFPPELDTVLRRALARVAKERFDNVLEWAEAFRQASGLQVTRFEVPRIDDASRARYLADAPQPIADAVSAYDSARNPHQAREAMRGIVRISAWYVGIVALACRTRIGPGPAGDSERVCDLLRDLRRQGLVAAGWIALAKQLVAPFARLPDTHPMPELVRLFDPAGPADAFSAALEGSLSESLADSSEEAVMQAIARELPTINSLLHALAFLLDYSVVVPIGTSGESWMGARGSAKQHVALRRALPERRPVLLDAAAEPLLALWPLVQTHVPVAGHPAQLFMLAGPGRRGARLVSSPHEFEHADEELWDWYRDRLFEHAETATARSPDANPYRGLATFTTNESEWFLGREREVETVVNRLKLEAFVAVIGPSGIGKSSFVHAGVVPAFGEARVVALRPGRAPIAQLAAQLSRAGFECAELRRDAEQRLGQLAARLHAWASSQGRVLVVVDQFEEVFTLSSDREEGDLFASILLAITRTTDAPVRAIITLRDDYLIRAEQLPGFDHALARGLQLLGPLGPPALEHILVEPARRAGYTFEDAALPPRMIAEVRGTPAAVALISFAAARLWELRDRHFHQLHNKAYEALGGVAGALARHADDTVDAMPAAERGLVRKAFRHLVTFEGTRALLRRDELVQLLGGGADADRTIERLVAARLLTASEGEHGDGSVEIIHETLIGAWPRLADWRREDVEGSRFHAQLRAAAKQWDDRARVRGLLWRGDALAEYELWRKRHPDALTPLEQDFARESLADARRGRRIRRGIVALVVVVAAVFVAFLLRANRAELRARDQTEALLREASYDRGRLLMVQGDRIAALDHLRDAYRMGETSAATRLMIGEASRNQLAKLVELDGEGRFWSVAYSPDGSRLATGGADGKARIWDANTGQPIEVLADSHGAVIAVAYAPDGKLLATAAGGGGVIVWDLATKLPLHSLDVPHALLTRLVFSPDGTRLLATGSGGMARIWDVRTGTLVGALPGLTGLTSGVFCARADCLATWDERGHVALWTASTLTVSASHDFGAPLESGAVDASGTTIAVGGAAGELGWVHADGSATWSPRAHEQTVFDVAFSPDGSVVATASNDLTGRLWNARTGERIAVLPGHRANLTGVRFSPTGDLLTTISADGTARIWGATTGLLLGELDGHTNIVIDAAFRSDGRRLATASFDHRVIVWDLATARQVQSLPPTAMTTDTSWRKLSFSPRSDRIVQIAPDRRIAVVDLESGQVRCRCDAAVLADAVAWNPVREQFAIAREHDAEVDLVRTDTCQVQRRLVHPAAVSAIAFGPRGQLVTGAADRTVRIWGDGETAAWSSAKYDGDISMVGESFDGSSVFVVVASPAGRTIVEQVLAQPSSRREFRMDAFDIEQIAYDSLRGRLLVASDDQSVWVWDERTASLIGKLEAAGPVNALVLSPDQALIVALGGITPTVFDAASLERIGILNGHTGLVTGGGFIDARVLVTSGEDNALRVWDVSRLQPMLMLLGAAQVELSPDERRTVLISDRGTLLWQPRRDPSP